MPGDGQLEKRLAAWDNVPHGSTLTIQVDAGDYVVTGSGKLRLPSGGATRFDLGFHELVEQPFVVPIARGVEFSLILTLTYVGTEPTTGRVRASVVTPDGDTFADPFACEYSGSLGSDSPEDDLFIIALGEP